MRNKQVLLAHRPHGWVKESDFSIVEAETPALGDKQILVAVRNPLGSFWNGASFVSFNSGTCWLPAQIFTSSWSFTNAPLSTNINTTQSVPITYEFFVRGVDGASHEVAIEEVARIRFGVQDLPPAAPDGEQIRLVGGGCVSGRIVSFDGDTGVIESVAGLLKLRRRDIQSLRLGLVEGVVEVRNEVGS